MFPFVDLASFILPTLGDVDVIMITDYPTGSYSTTTGQWVQGTPTVTSVEAVVQQATPKDTEQLPENERTKESIVVFTRTALFTSDVTTAEESNTITWEGREYKVMMIDAWSRQAQYVRHIAVRLGV